MSTVTSTFVIFHRRRGCALELKSDQLSADCAVANRQPAKGDGEPKPAWPGAPRIEKQNAVADVHRGLVRVARDHCRDSSLGWIDWKFPHVVNEIYGAVHQLNC